MASIKKKNGKWAVRVSYYDEFGKRHFKNKSGFSRKKKLNSGQLNWNKLSLTNP
ncbi:hypothetical protein RYX41_08125 [Lactiplantibacillus plantarum]|nr:hypothetical protein [Lactiplantibacillus plantarum]